MKVELKDHSPIKKSMTIEVPADEVARETDRVVQRYAQKVDLPGFRKGKVPRGVVENRFRKEIREDVRDGLISRLWGEAAEERGLRPIGDPTLDDVHFEDGDPFRFATTFEIAPELEPKGYKDVEVSARQAPVSEDDVAEALEELRQARAGLASSEGDTAGHGLFILGDLEVTPEGEESFTREAALVELGSSGHPPAFDEALEGAGAGDVREFSIPYPEDFPSSRLAGKSVAYKVTVTDIKRKVTPDLDDEFAKGLEMDGLDALTERVREDLGHRREAEWKAEVRRKVLDGILLENPVPLPEVLVESEVRHRLEDTARSMVMQGLDLDKVDGEQWKRLRDAQEEGARKTVHARLVLDAVARVEGLDVADSEVDERIRLEAERIGEKPKDVKERLAGHGGLQAIKLQLLREKSLDFVTSVANIRREE